MGLRKCKKCGKISEDICFATFRMRNGEKARRNVCKECRAKQNNKTHEEMVQYRKDYNKKNRSKQALSNAERRNKAKSIINKIKEETPCTDCGGFFPAVAMDFDHIGVKNRGVAQMVSQAYKMDLILEEIKLCELVCANCHRVRTHDRKQGLAPKKKDYNYPSMVDELIENNLQKDLFL